eukprot:scaffold40454_cov17-Prasinocladus_malaysianus.AAC.1
MSTRTATSSAGARRRILPYDERQRTAFRIYRNGTRSRYCNCTRSYHRARSTAGPKVPAWHIASRIQLPS